MGRDARFCVVRRALTPVAARIGSSARGDILNQDTTDRTQYPRSFMARRARPWRNRTPRRSVILADQLDAYLGMTAPMRPRPLGAGLVVRNALVDNGPVPHDGGRQGR